MGRTALTAITSLAGAVGTGLRIDRLCGSGTAGVRGPVVRPAGTVGGRRTAQVGPMTALTGPVFARRRVSITFLRTATVVVT